MSSESAPPKKSHGIARPSAKTLDRLEAEITELWGHLTAATYRFLMLVAEFDRSEAYVRHGLPSTAHWLNWQCGIGMTAARAKVRVARALEHLPEVSAGFASGEFSYSKVRAITRVATPANESVLVHIARYGTASHVEKLVRKYRWTQQRDAEKNAQTQHLNRCVHYFYDENDTFVLNARLPPEIGAIVAKVLQAAGDVLRESPDRESAPHDSRHEREPRDERAELARHGSGSTLPWSVLSTARAADRADALRLVADAFLAARSEEVESTSTGDRFQVVVHVDQAVLAVSASVLDTEPHHCELDAGPGLALATARRLCCDSTAVGILEGRDGEPLNIGRKSRAIPPTIRRAMLARDGGCRFPGCDRTRFCNGHHVKHWANGGETKLGNLVTLCSFHHTAVHEGGFGVTVTDDGVFVFTRPDGTRIPESGSMRIAPRIDETERFRGIVARLNPDPNVKIDANTSRCKWLGERMDYSAAIEAMQFREINATTTAVAPS
ncbi:MAG TPA: DUF222 domain-containing protein [Gammaproteobacteria bacterium]|nr:DUF222 domain-containing protein [Gammaproteobacteria bacterium]